VRISEISIERPVLATVMSLVIVLIGAISLGRLTNRELPDVDPPVVSVTTVFRGAAPDVVETSVTQVLEDELIGIEGIRHVTSLSREQVSDITIEFELYRDVDEAANDVRDRVARVRDDLPEDADDPVVAKRESDASPIMWVALHGADYSQLDMSTLAETRIKDRLSKLPGVSFVLLAGERRYSMRVWVDNVKLTSTFLTVADIQAALERENVEIPSGRVEGVDREFTVRTLGELKTAEAFGRLIIAEVDGVPVRLEDVARVEVGPEDERKLVRFDGDPAVGLGVIKQSNANTVDVTDAVKAEVKALRHELPPGVKMEVAYDSSIYIKRSVADVTTTIFEAVVFVIVVIYLFLRRFRSTLVPAVAIPVSVIGTFSVLYALGFSINTLTLMGLTLAIGLVVDDAIVVLENITRWVESGMDPHAAARRGIAEISFAVLAATIAVIAVFLPLSFLTDQTGRLFREFGVTVAAAVAISGFVALTLSPSLCARVLRPHGPEHGVKLALERGFSGLLAGYQRLLTPAMAHPVASVVVGAAWFLIGVWLLSAMPREFVPTADRGNLLVLTEAPEGSTIDYTDFYHRQVEEIVRATPETVKTFSVVALGIGTPGVVNRGAMFVMLVPWEDRERSQQQIVAGLIGKLWAIPGIKAFAINPPTLGQSFGSSPIQVVLQGPDIEQLGTMSDELMRRASRIPGLVNVRSDLVLDKPQLLARIDRDRASDLGVSTREVASTLQILLGGVDLSTFKLQGETYKVMVQLDKHERTEAKDLYELYVHGRGGELIPLQSVITLEESTAPRGLPHFDRLRSATVSASLLPGASLGTALDAIRSEALDVIGGAHGFRVAFSGESESFYESSNSLAFAYVLALVIIYLVLAAQFESFLHPLTILIAVALSFTGALVTLFAFGDTLNLYSEIGLVMLIGLVTKNSILIVEFANQLRERGNSAATAAYEASLTRFRPILMTAISTIVGILPIAIGSGAGGESRASLGVAVAGGMLFSTVLTVFVVPPAYVLLEAARERVLGVRGTANVVQQPAGEPF